MVFNTFENHYINPFDEFLKKDTLYNLSSGAAMPAEVTIFSHYMKTENNFATSFPKVESLQQQKLFTVRSPEITTKSF